MADVGQHIGCQLALPPSVNHTQQAPHPVRMAIVLLRGEQGFGDAVLVLGQKTMPRQNGLAQLP